MSVGFRKTLISSQVDGPALTAAAAATCIPAAARKTILANFFDTIGEVMYVRILGRISCVVTTPGTARWDLRMGGTVIFDTGAMPLNIVAKVNVGFQLDLTLTARVIGSAGNFFGQGTFVSEAFIGSPVVTAGGNGCITVPYNSAPAVGGNVDLTSSQALDCFFTQTVGTGSMTVHQYIVECPTYE